VVGRGDHVIGVDVVRLRASPSRWTSTRSATAATRPAWTATTSAARARRRPAC
jgi:hypothetical protein